jgi:hypothetical protein
MHVDSADFDNTLLAQLALDIPRKTLSSASIPKSVLTQPIDADIFDAFFRLEELLEAPEQIPFSPP